MTFENFGAVEWTAFVIAAFGIVKMLVLFVNKSAWVNSVSMPVLKSKATQWIAGLLTLYLGYLFLPMFGIVQLFAMFGLFAAFYATIFTLFDFDFSSYVKKYLKSGWTPAQVIVSLVWLALSVWVLMELF